MSTRTTMFLFLAVALVAVVAAAFIGPDDILFAIFPELEVLAEEVTEETQAPEGGATEAVDTNTATQAPTFTETPTPVPPTITPTFTPTEVPRTIECGPFCANLFEVIDSAGILLFPNRGFDTRPIEEVGAENCIGVMEYVEPGGVFSGEFATCLDTRPGHVRICDPNSSDWRVACSGDYTLAIFRVEGLSITDIPFYSAEFDGGFLFPATLLTDTQYHLGNGYVPLMMPGEFSADTLAATQQRFRCVYQPMVDNYGTSNGNIDALAVNLVAAFPASSYSGDLIRSSTSIWVNATETTRGHFENRSGLPLYWTNNPWYDEVDCP